MPMDGDVARITRRAEELRDLPEALQRNLQTFLTLTMDALATTHQKVKSSMTAETNKQTVRGRVPRCVVCMLMHGVSDVERVEEEVALAHGLCGHSQVPHVSRCVLVSCTIGRGDRVVIASSLCTLHDILPRRNGITTFCSTLPELAYSHSSSRCESSSFSA